MSEGLKLPRPGRLAMVIVSIVLWSGFIFFRLIQLQIIRHQEFVQLAQRQQQITMMALAPRGIIYDRHMDELASSMTVSTVAAEPKHIPDKAAAARNLASVLELDPRQLLERLNDPKKQTYQIIKRRIDPTAEAKLEAMDQEGVHLYEESMRVYPNRSLASHVLGFVNMEGIGSAGIEREYNKELCGTPGLVTLNVDGRRRLFRGKVEKSPVQGNSLVLCIDKSIQYIAERELAAGVEKAKAAHGVAIVMESDTGKILALASYPDFNCNVYNEYEAELWRNRAVSDLFEPGSTFKVVVTTAALDAGLTRPEEIIDCQMGAISVGKHIFHDHKSYGLLTFKQVIEVSSNIGAVKLGLRLGEQRLHQALIKFGFGAKTQVDLPAEIVGLVRDLKDWSALSVAAISFGQEVGVTSIQMLVAINAIANGGYRLRPYIVDRIISPQGDLVRFNEPQRTQIMKPETAARVRDAFEGVILRGTGKKAVLQGYRAGGKTGTAQKIIDGRYSNTKYVASFVGFAPLPQPRITVLVQIDEPRGAIYGGDVSAPVFQRIAQEALLQLRVPPDRSLPLPKFNPALASAGTEDFLPNATPVFPRPLTIEPIPNPETADSIILRVGDASVEMPDFHGMAKRKVIERCLDLGIQMHPVGTGIAVFQIPPPGTRMPTGDACSVTFAQGNTAAYLKVPGLESGIVAQRHASAPAERLPDGP